MTVDGCPNGASIDTCTMCGDTGCSCWYQVGGQQFPCGADCDCNAAAQEAADACVGDIGGGGGPTDACGGSCGSDEQCCSGTCIPAGDACCSDGTGCASGQSCATGGGCIPQGAADCGNGTYCPKGDACAKDVCIPQGATSCGNGYCAAGEVCGSGQTCAAPDLVDCGDGTYCPGGSTCSGEICASPPPPGTTDCGDGTYCPEGTTCSGTGTCDIAQPCPGLQFACGGSCCSAQSACCKGSCMPAGTDCGECTPGEACADGSICCSFGSCPPPGMVCAGPTFCPKETPLWCTDGVCAPEGSQCCGQGMLGGSCCLHQVYCPNGLACADCGGGIIACGTCAGSQNAVHGAAPSGSVATKDETNASTKGSAPAKGSQPSEVSGPDTGASGCGCETAGGATHGGWLFAALGVALTRWRRRGGPGATRS